MALPLPRSICLMLILIQCQMVTFCALVAPLPYGVRKRLFRFLSESLIVAKIAYGLKISFMSVPPIILPPGSSLFYMAGSGHNLWTKVPNSV